MKKLSLSQMENVNGGDIIKDTVCLLMYKALLSAYDIHAALSLMVACNSL